MIVSFWHFLMFVSFANWIIVITSNIINSRCQLNCVKWTTLLTHQTLAHIHLPHIQKYITVKTCLITTIWEEEFRQNEPGPKQLFLARMGYWNISRVSRERADLDTPRAMWHTVGTPEVVNTTNYILYRSSSQDLPITKYVRYGHAIQANARLSLRFNSSLRIGS